MSGLTLPVRARWVDGKIKGGRILLDPSSFPLRFKKEEGHRGFYVCQRTSDLKCPVRVSLHVEEDMIVRVEGDHNHDSDLVKQQVEKIVEEKILLLTEYLNILGSKMNDE